MGKQEYTEEQIASLKNALNCGGPFTGTAERIYLKYKTDTTAADRIALLKEEFGEGGRSYHAGGYDGVSYHAKGIELTSYKDEKKNVLFSWSFIDKIYPEVLYNENAPYLKALYGYHKGIFCLPVSVKDGVEPDLRQDEFLDYYLTKETITGLYQKVADVLAHNYETYTPEQLFGRTQRIGINNDNKLQVALIYCYDEKGQFNVEAYNRAIERLAKTYGNEYNRVRIPAKISHYTSMLESYVGIPAEYTEAVFDHQKALHPAVTAFYKWYTTENEYPRLTLNVENKDSRENDEIENDR